MMPEIWNLRSRLPLSGGEIAWDVLGYGPPLILVHGTPSRSYIWRDVAMRLADRFTVYVFDLLGFGQSKRREGLDVSIANQSRLLAELVGAWELEAPSVAGHDIGGTMPCAPTCSRTCLSGASPWSTASSSARG
jgi:pimeloyl-ACP methyl ester carboxylesterase